MTKFLKLMATASFISLASSTMAWAEKVFTVALIPGLTTDAFYITMHKGAEAAAQEFGVNLIYQGRRIGM